MNFRHMVVNALFIGEREGRMHWGEGGEDALGRGRGGCIGEREGRMHWGEGGEEVPGLRAG